tara:strand:+ start:128 stop:256 length:129 start_codon:yes stop_codon:yes gene_type:complete
MTAEKDDSLEMEAIRETWAFDEGLFFTDDEELEEDYPELADF